VGEVLIYGDGQYHVAELIDVPSGAEAAFMDVHSSDLVPWPSHWLELVPPPKVDR
jgi:hypothetical protein